MFKENLDNARIYSPEGIDVMVSLAFEKCELIKTNKKIEYYNVPCAFDIETSSFLNCREKVAIMYEWTLGLNGLVMIGRTWEEFDSVMNYIIEHLGLNENRHLIIYVHNLSYEMQFIRKRFLWTKVFAISMRKPIYAITETGLEFRCSYLLSGYSLAKVAEHLKSYNIKKLVGDLDYNLVRHSNTPLTNEEIAYCVNDVKIVMAYIDNCMTDSGSIVKIPLTKTGYVRKYCRNKCFYEEGKKQNKSYKRFRYMEMIKSLTLEPEEYTQLKRAFQGGFTHANPFYSGVTLENVSSDDFTSSYPTVMVSEQFPMSSAEMVTDLTADQFYHDLKLYCCLFDVEITGLKPIVLFENYLSYSHCWNVINAVTNNGRIVSADHLFTTLTEIDYSILKRFYSWDSMKVGNFRRYRKDYLPKDFVTAILKLYGDKTKLKGVEGKEAEYLSSKEMLNSCYGMAVTDIVRDEITYNGEEWGTERVDIESEVIKYNESPSRFLFYPWGVW